MIIGFSLSGFDWSIRTEQRLQVVLLKRAPTAGRRSDAVQALIQSIYIGARNPGRPRAEVRSLEHGHGGNTQVSEKKKKKGGGDRRERRQEAKGRSVA